MTLSNSVRLGVFRDRPVFEAASYGEIVVPAHIAAYAGDGLWGFLQGIATQQDRRTGLFRYDPMTYLLYIPARYWLKTGAGDRYTDGEPLSIGDLRPALREMLDAYGLLEPAVLTSVAAARSEFLSQGALRCLDFQRRGSEAAQLKTITKYAAILGQEVKGKLEPSRLVAPYAAVDPWAGPGMRDQERLNELALGDRRNGESMWSVLALTGRQGLRPTPESVAQRLHLGAFDGIGLWVGGMDEYTATSGTLRLYRQVVGSLGRPVWIMFGGYFSLLLHEDGVVDVSHGVYYTESKLVRGIVGSGPAPDRYYVPSLHRFYDPPKAFAILRMLPEYECSCPECGGVESLEAALLATGADKTRRMAWTQRLQRHFLAARADEVNHVTVTERATLLEELEATARAVDAIQESRRQIADLTSSHLKAWLAALR